jgi:DNA-binding NarL/FixJ family response regulator
VTRAVRLAAAAVGNRAETLQGRTQTAFSTRVGQLAMEDARHRLGAAAYDLLWAEGEGDRLEVAVAAACELAETLMALTSKSTVAASPEGWPGGLSEREVEVLRLVARGRTNAEVAADLFISRRTVDSHMRRIYDRLGLDTRADVVRFAIEHGLA